MARLDIRFDFLGHLQSIHHRHHDVTDHNVYMVFRQLIKTILTIFCSEHVILLR